MSMLFMVLVTCTLFGERSKLHVKRLGIRGVYLNLWSCVGEYTTICIVACT